MCTVAVNISGALLEGLCDIHPVIRLTSELYVSVFVSLIQNYVWTQVLIQVHSNLTVLLQVRDWHAGAPGGRKLHDCVFKRGHVP